MGLFDRLFGRRKAAAAESASGDEALDAREDGEKTGGSDTLVADSAVEAGGTDALTADGAVASGATDSVDSAEPLSRGVAEMGDSVNSTEPLPRAASQQSAVSVSSTEAITRDGMQPQDSASSTEPSPSADAQPQTSVSSTAPLSSNGAQIQVPVNSSELPSRAASQHSAVSVSSTESITHDSMQPQDSISSTASLLNDSAQIPISVNSSELPSRTASQQSAVSVSSPAPLPRTSEQSSASVAPSAPLSRDNPVTPADSLPSDSPQPSPEPVAPAKENQEQKYERSLKKSSRTFGQRFNALLANFRTVDEEFFEDLEETLILSDVGAPLALEIAEELRQEAKLANAKSKEALRRLIIEKMVDKFGDEAADESLNISPDGLTVFLFIGVNGVGKTTTIGKLAARYVREGKRVLLAAADTFRAGAIDQLVVWGNRAGVETVTKPEGSDPASVVYDAMAKAKSEHYDILLVDTAGRLQNKDNLMKELAKIGKVIQRELPDAPQETILALDATTGQNAVQQAKDFTAVTPITGIALTKLDGSAKGGIVLSIVQSLKIPVKLVGLGEQIDDLEDFNANAFIIGLFGDLI